MMSSWRYLPISPRTQTVSSFPGVGAAREPGIHNHKARGIDQRHHQHWAYGYRARAFSAPRNDGTAILGLAGGLKHGRVERFAGRLARPDRELESRIISLA